MSCHLPLATCFSRIIIDDFAPFITGNSPRVATPKCINGPDVTIHVGCEKIVVRYHEKILMHKSSSKLGHHVLLNMPIISIARLGLILISFEDGWSGKRRAAMSLGIFFPASLVIIRWSPPRLVGQTHISHYVR
jgi:hypothetical protein